MKKILVTTVVVLACTFANANASNLAIIDVEKIVKESVAMKDVQKKVSAKQEQYQAEINKKQSQLEAEQKKIESKKNVLSKEAYEKEVNAFEKKVEELKSFVEKKQEVLKKSSVEAMTKVNEVVKKIIADISKEKQVDVIIPASQALFFKDELDVSAEVAKRLNKEITKVTVKFE